MYGRRGEGDLVGAYYCRLFLFFLCTFCGFVLLSVVTFVSGEPIMLTIHIVERQTQQ